MTTILTSSSQHDPKVVEAALDDCLQELGLEYLDVSIRHRFPIPRTDIRSSTLSTFPSLSRVARSTLARTSSP